MNRFIKVQPLLFLDRHHDLETDTSGSLLAADRTAASTADRIGPSRTDWEAVVPVTGRMVAVVYAGVATTAETTASRTRKHCGPAVLSAEAVLPPLIGCGR
jgi:hypothetical protein